jgi:hypothetical protein
MMQAIIERSCGLDVRWDGERGYGRPIYAVLEGHFELIVGNARHIRNAGCKTDMRDSERMAVLVRQVLIAKSLVPPGQQVYEQRRLHALARVALLAQVARRGQARCLRGRRPLV